MISTVSSRSSLVLVVDDDDSMRIMLRRAMEREGYRVIDVKNGEECLKRYTEMQPDVVLMDAIMPVMDGFDCCAKLQLLSGADRTPVLMITGLEDKQSVDRAFEVGAADYVTKPIHWPVLCQRVRRLIHQVKLYQQLEAANQELQRLVGSDGLTKLANRRRFDEYLNQQWQQLRREGFPLSLILCDIDYFKCYNDTYGHLLGDDCLQRIAGAIQQAAKRSIDLAARYGGEEFAVILPNTPEEGAVQVCKAIQTLVRDLAIPHSGSKVTAQVTLSLGIATLIPDSQTPETQIITLADKALYQAKHEGRDRFCVYAAS